MPSAWPPARRCYKAPGLRRPHHTEKIKGVYRPPTAHESPVQEACPRLWILWASAPGHELVVLLTKDPALRLRLAFPTAP